MVDFTDAQIGKYWPDMDTPEGRAEIRRQLAAMQKNLRAKFIPPVDPMALLLADVLEAFWGCNSSAVKRLRAGKAFVSDGPAKAVEVLRKAFAPAQLTEDQFVALAVKVSSVKYMTDSGCADFLREVLKARGLKVVKARPS